MQCVVAPHFLAPRLELFWRSSDRKHIPKQEGNLCEDLETGTMSKVGDNPATRSSQVCQIWGPQSLSVAKIECAGGTCETLAYSFRSLAFGCGVDSRIVRYKALYCVAMTREFSLRFTISPEACCASSFSRFSLNDEKKSYSYS